MAQFVENYPNLARIMQFTDLDSLKWEQYARHARLPMSWVYRTEHGRLSAYERHLATSFNHSLLCTPRELEDFRRLIPGAPASCVGNGVDLAYFRPAGLPKQNALIFTGIMDYFPNVDGVVWFCHEILPRIRAVTADVTLTICGARPSAAVRALGRLPGVVVTGKVPDVRPYMAESTVCVVPLRIARGVQNKLLAAMAMGMAVVTTSAASAGVEAKPGRDLFVADDPADFAAAVVKLLRDEGLRRSTNRAARASMEAKYDWDDQLARLDVILADVVAGKQQKTPVLEGGTTSAAQCAEIL
jgi:sugar transferase (PEP-CTERM/EpsH1 system associated)